MGPAEEWDVGGGRAQPTPSMDPVHNPCTTGVCRPILHGSPPPGRAPADIRGAGNDNSNGTRRASRREAWPYLALFGTGVFVHFSSVSMMSRAYLGKGGKKVGRPASVRAASVFGAIWIGAALTMASLAVTELIR